MAKEEFRVNVYEGTDVVARVRYSEPPTTKVVGF